MTKAHIKEALEKQIYYLESIQRQMNEYRDFVGSCEVLTPSIGGDVLADNLDWLDCHIADLKRDSCPSDGAIYAAVSKAETAPDERAAIDAHIDGALATLSPPAGEMREAIARIICYWDQTGTCHDNYCGGSCRAKKPNAEFFKAADAILASGLVQDEAGWRDISTAPYDGTGVLIAEDVRGSCGEAYYDIVNTCWFWANTNAGDYPYPHEPFPTHWRPLPAPPIRSARDGGAES